MNLFSGTSGKLMVIVVTIVETNLAMFDFSRVVCVYVVDDRQHIMQHYHAAALAPDHLAHPLTKSTFEVRRPLHKAK